MSVHVSSWVWRHRSTLPDGPFRLLLALADMANDEGYAWPAVRTLRERCGGCSERSIQERTRYLAEAGVIEKLSRQDRSGRTTSNEYRVVMVGEIAQPVGGRVRNPAPSPGEPVRTLPPQPASPSPRSQLHPPYSETSVDPSVEPTPLAPRAGGDGRGPVDVEVGLSDVEARLFREHRFRIPRKHRREVRRRLRIGETVEAIVADLAPAAAPAAWEPPPATAGALAAWAPVLAALRNRGDISPASLATWIEPLQAVGIWPAVDGGARADLLLAAPTEAASQWLQSNFGPQLHQTAGACGVSIRFWTPAEAGRRAAA